MATKKETAEREVLISPPNFKIASFTILGDAPYVQNAFSQKAKEQIKATQMGGRQSKSKKNREPKDFEECYRQSMHVSKEGWYGMPAAGFRAAMVSACRLVGYKMTIAKMAVFIVADGFDKNDGTPLVRITKGEPHYCEHHKRLESGVVDLGARAMWDEGWEAELRIKFDEDLFSLQDVANLLSRVGAQVGVGEGRPDSRKSTGMGWGTFSVKPS